MKNNFNNLCLFVEKTPFMGVELLDLLSDYCIVSYNDDYTTKLLSKNGYNIVSYGNTALDKNIDSDEAAIKILNDKKFLDSHTEFSNETGLLFFYMNRKMNDLAKQNSLKLFLPSYDTQEFLGSKLNITSFTKDLDLPYYKSLNFEDSKNKEELFQKCEDQLGLPFIVQGKQGVSGEDTILVKNKKTFDEFYKKNKEFKASYFVKKSIPISMQVCITNEESIIRGPFLQILGFEELSSNPFQFSGGDLNQKLLSEKIKNNAINYSKKLANYFKQKGFLGIFGIDYLWDLDTGECYLQEINSRLVGLTRLLTGIQKNAKITPDLIKHINAFLPVEKQYKLNGYHDDSETSTNFHGSQLYIANNSNRKVLIKNYLEPGIYAIKHDRLNRSKDSLFMKDLNKDEILITYSAYKNSDVSPNGTLAKVLLSDTVIEDNSYSLTSEAKKVISVIRNNLLN